MKIHVDFDQLEGIAEKYGSAREFGLDLDQATPWADIDIRLQQGVEVDLSQIEVLDGLLSYEGRHVILYIRDHGRNVSQALADPGIGRRYHLADCVTLNEMRERNRFDRYVVTRRHTGQFEIAGTDLASRREVVGDASLQVCMNCLKRLNYQSYLLNSNVDRRKIRDRFAIAEFFETYSTYFRDLPSGFASIAGSAAYTSDWPEVSARCREQVGYCCQDCGVNLHAHRSLLHVHHVNGVKGDNRSANLRVLCKDCHRKQPGHDRMFVSSAEMLTLYRLRRQQLLVQRTWPSAIRNADLAVRSVLELARHHGWDAPDVGVPIQGRAEQCLDAVWPEKQRAISSTAPPGRLGPLIVERPGYLLDELSEGFR